MKLKKSIKTIAPYFEGKGSRSEGIKLSSNEAPFSPDAASKKALLKALCDINRYPPKNPAELRSLIAGQYKLGEENIVLGNGSDELMQFIYMAFVERGDKVIIPKETFLMYGIYADIFGAKRVCAPMKEDHSIDLDGILKQIDAKTKLVFLANPNNPTGMFFSMEQAESFIKKTPAHTLVVIDAAYMDFSAKNFEKDFPMLIRKGKHNVIFLRTFSKSFGMAGLRLGYSVSDRETSMALDGMRQPFNINSLALSLADNLSRRKSFVRRRLSVITRERNIMEDFFKKNSIKFLPTEANFFCIPVNNAAGFCDYCREKRLFIRHLRDFGMPGFVRVTLSLPAHNSRFRRCLLNFLSK